MTSPFTTEPEISAELIHLLLSRLERISVDSYWAHRASGVRGALIRIAEKIEADQSFENLEINQLVKLGFKILEFSAKEKRVNRKIGFR
jgi:hypothetical protein